MTGSENFLRLSRFSHIYVERRAMEYPVAREILNRFPHSIKVFINHYKDVFNRPRQDFRRQKISPKLILAVKEEPFLYRGPDICEDFGNENFFYVSTVLNCIYDCDYCYLQGLYPSANIVVFVNIEDFFDAVRRRLCDGPLYLCVSYDTDLLALAGIVPYAASWIEFARGNDGLLVELRTKSVNYAAVKSLEPTEHVILAWSLSPREIAQKYERAVPPLDARLEAARAAIEDGWKVRLCFEPILMIKDWQRIYSSFIDDVFGILPPGCIHDMNVGVFRMNKRYFKKISDLRSDTDIFCYPVECRDGVVTYKNGAEMRKHIYEKLLEYCPAEKIY